MAHGNFQKHCFMLCYYAFGSHVHVYAHVLIRMRRYMRKCQGTRYDGIRRLPDILPTETGLLTLNQGRRFMANPPTNIVGFRGFDQSIILI